MASKINPKAIAKIMALKAAMSGGRPGMPPQAIPPQAPPGMKKGGSVKAKGPRMGIESKGKTRAKIY